MSAITQAPYSGVGIYPAWLEELREQAQDRFDSMDWPGTELEEWRRSRLMEYDLERFVWQPREARLEHSSEQPRPGYITDIQVHDDQVQFRGSLPTGVDIYALHLPGEWDRMEQTLQGFVRDNLARAAAGVSHRLQAWHLSQLSGLLVVRIQPGTSLSEPLLLEWMLSGQSGISSPRVMLWAGENSAVSLDIVYRSLSARKILHNGSLHLQAGSDSRIHLTQSQFLNRSSLFFQENRLSLNSGAQVEYQENLLGARYSRIDSGTALEGKSARAELKGLFLAGPGQKTEIHTLQDHIAPQAWSRAYYKGMARDDGYSLYDGMIRVEPGAEQTDAYLTNKNLLLNKGACAYSMPKLRIMNDNVKCSHGSTTGRINAEHLFYLQARGFSQAQAVELLTQAFFSELLENSRDYVSRRILDYLEQPVSLGDGV